jgi:hypothetical protein
VSGRKFETHGLSPGVRAPGSGLQQERVTPKP